ncbi:MAG: ATP-binding cassette domain-containing protein, partial [Gammaproteobacteria bacterium]
DKTIDNSNVRAWQRHISSVPQYIYLTDGTLEENIAFGISKNEIDFSRVKDAAHKAQISDLVEGLKDGYQTLVGERVAVARAFYQQSDILVLDEATSALDDSTELAVMDAITNLNHKSMTVIIIAHRISTLSNCDMIFRLGNDFKTELLTYDELTKLNIREVQDA